MNMSMALRPMMRMGCLTCGGYNDEHIRDCPAKLIEEVQEKEFRYYCPKCQGNAGIDLDDVICCRICKSRFSLLIGRVANPDDPEKTIIHQVNPSEDFISVLVLADKGTKPFKVDQILSMLHSQQKAWRARLRAERRAAREPKRRHARQAPCSICGPLFCRYAP